MSLQHEQQMIYDMAFEFGQSEIAPIAYECERTQTIPRVLLQKAGALGLGGIYIDSALGGSGLGRKESILIFEALSQACPTIAAFISIHNLGINMVAKYAKDHIKQTILPDLINMKSICGYCLTEPQSGSDAAALSTRATKDNENYVLNGRKAFISGANYSDYYVIMCRTGDSSPNGISSLLVDAKANGLSFGHNERKMGWKAQTTAEVRMENCYVPIDYVLGEEGKGFHYAMDALDSGRLNIAACSLGAASQAMATARKYMNERKAFGKLLNQFQALQFRMADLETKLEASRVFLYHAADQIDAQAADKTLLAAQAKLYVTETAWSIVDGALQMLGGYGYLEDFGIEKLLRDIRVHRILEGSSEIMHLIINRASNQ